MRQTSGSRTYPAGYGFDAQGRTTTLTTWTNFPSSSAAVTTWNFDGSRGWLNSKQYAHNSEPFYTYTRSFGMTNDKSSMKNFQFKLRALLAAGRAASLHLCGFALKSLVYP